MSTEGITELSLDAILLTEDKEVDQEVVSQIGSLL
jgi:hypothetical protein